MKDNKGTTILLTVIGIATLLVAVVGATFAYFTAQVTGNDDTTDVTVTAANLGTVTFEHSNVIDLCDDSLGDACSEIYPGAIEEKTFTVKHTADAQGVDSTVPVDYEVYLVITENSLRAAGEGETITETGNLKATLTAPTGLAEGASATSNFATATSLSTDNADHAAGKRVLIGTGTLKAGADEHEWSLKVELVNAATEQNDDQGRKFSARIVVEAATKYTVNGTEYTGA